MTTVERMFKLENSLSEIKCIVENALFFLESPESTKEDIELAKTGLRTVIDYCSIFDKDNSAPKTPAQSEVELPCGLIEDDSVSFNDAFEVYA